MEHAIPFISSDTALRKSQKHIQVCDIPQKILETPMTLSDAILKRRLALVRTCLGGMQVGFIAQL
jgi:hypothetical protein